MPCKEKKHDKTNLAKTLIAIAKLARTNSCKSVPISPRTIKVRNAHALDTAIETDQGCSLQITDKGVVLNAADRMFSLGSNGIGFERAAVSPDPPPAVGRTLTLGIPVILFVTCTICTFGFAHLLAMCEVRMFIVVRRLCLLLLGSCTLWVDL